MKTPLAILGILLAAASARAADTPAPVPHRCDVAWLQNLPKSMSEGVELDPARVEVGPDKKYRLKIGYFKTCSDPAWRHVVTPDKSFNVQGVAIVHNTKEGEDLWNKSIVHQAARLLVVDDLFQMVDAKGLEVIKNAEAVIAAGEALGIVTRVEGQSVAHDLGEELTGEPFRSIKVLEVKAAENGVAKVKGPEAVRAELEKIVKDAPGGAKAHGAAVAAFHKSLVELYQMLAESRSKTPLSAKRFGTLEPKPTADYLCASCQSVPIGARDDGSFTPESFDAALKALVGQGIKNEGDPQSITTAHLNAFDRGMRNLIAVRAAQVATVQAAAAKLLGPDGVQAHITGVRLAEKGAQQQVDPKSVGGQMLAALAKSKDYQDLSQLYDNKRAQPGWLESPEGQSVVAAMSGMENDAKASQITADNRFEFTVGGQKRVANNVAVERFAYDADYRAQIMGTVAGYIAEGNTADAKVQAALAAFRGAGQSGQPLGGNLTSDQRELSGNLPKPTPVDAGPKGPVATAKEAGCGSPADLGKSSMERYADKRKRAAAEAAADNSSAREKLQKKREARLAEVDEECSIERNWINTGRKTRVDADGIEVAGPKEQLPYMNPDLDKAAALAELEKHCAARRQAVVDQTLQEAKDKGIVGSKAEDERRKKAEEEADNAIEEQYKMDIAQSFDDLRTAYKTEGTPQRKAVEAATGYTGKFYKVERIEEYFKENWDDRKEESTKDCMARLGYKRGLSPSDNDFKSADKDNVDKHCGPFWIKAGVPEGKKKAAPVGVREGVISKMKAHLGGVSTVVETPKDPVPQDGGTAPKKPAAPNLDDQLNGN